MAALKDIRKRIGSVKSTQKITRAMKMVSASKLRRAQEAIAQAELDFWPGFRTGTNLGDIIVQEARIYGDGVNISARLEKLAQPGGEPVCAR